MSQGFRVAPFDTAGVASVEEGVVLLDGPDGIAISLTAEAALATGQSLIEAATQVRSQRQANDGNSDA